MGNQDVRNQGDQMEQVFNFGEARVRTLVIDVEPWFVAKDVCEVLGIVNHKDAVSRLSNTMKSGVAITDPHGRQQYTNIISEPGLYKLIFQSRKPEAEAFADWVAEEVLPAIRRKGTYVAPQVSQLEVLHQLTEIMLKKEKEDAERDRLIAQNQKQLEVVNYRINNLDNINTEGDRRTRLNAIIRKYAFDNGIKNGLAWNVLKRGINRAFRMNLEKRITHHKMKHGKQLTVPQYLEEAGLLDDALRVADKMLNTEPLISRML